MRTRYEAVRNAWRTEEDRGAVLFILVLFLVIFIAVAAVAVDLAATGARGQDLQNTTDAAALAAVVEYQEQLLLNPSDPAAAEAAALAIATAIAEQNGADFGSGDLTIDLEISADGSQATVTIKDNNPDEFLPNSLLGDTIKPGGRSVEREATADFIACPDSCTVTIGIPDPFRSVSARGNGDGYKPIFVNGRLYALNHNTPNRNIVCVDRVTQDPCWIDAAGNPQVFRDAYAPGVNFNDRNPEMPQTAVVGSRIYWSVTDTFNGLRLFCWETTTDTPCLQAHTLDSTLLRLDEEVSPLTSDKDENRGSGTVAVGNKVFVFSDNQRIHCYDPSFGGVCAGYNTGGNLTALGDAGFPELDPADGNHGSSIDRIVDERSGYVYATLHIPNAVPSINCNSPLPGPEGERVVIKNELTGNFIRSDIPDLIVADPDGSVPAAWWDAENFGVETVSYQSVEHGEYIAAIPFASTSVDQDEETRWNNNIDGTAYFINSEFGADIYGVLRESVFGSIIEELEPPSSPDARWNFYPWQCGDPSFTGTVGPAGMPTPDYFKSGTWLHCYDTGVVSNTPGKCPGFQVNGVGTDAPGSASPIHLDGSRFSGRLWFYRDSGGFPTGVCSSGYGATFTPSAIEVNCVRLDNGNFDSVMTSAMGPVRDEIRVWTGNSPGAWGDPHWNASENRLFYPTEHNTSRIICYDFDSGPCPSQTGTVAPNPSGLTATEDYGFVSEGNCVFALGHNAFFWAFKASDIGQACDAQPLPTEIAICPCGNGLSVWGQLDFSGIDLDRFDVFAVRIVTDDSPTATPIFPSNGSFHSIKPGGASLKISLSDLATNFPEGTTSVWIEVYVEGAGGQSLADIGDFDVRTGGLPKLVD